MVVMTVAAVALGGIALPAAAKGGPKARGKQQTVEVVSAKGKAKAQAQKAARKAAARERKEAAKARKAARFVAVGFVTQVDTAEVQVQVKGGKKALRKLSREEGSVAFTVTDQTRIKLDGVRLTLAELAQIAAGHHVVVKGAADDDGNYVARKLFAQTPELEEEEEEELEEEIEEIEELTEDDDGSGDDGSGGDDSVTT